MRTRRNSYGEKKKVGELGLNEKCLKLGKRKRKLFDLNPDSDSSSSFWSICSSKVMASVYQLCIFVSLSLQIWNYLSVLLFKYGGLMCTISLKSIGKFRIRLNIWHIWPRIASNFHVKLLTASYFHFHSKLHQNNKNQK